MLLSGAAQTGCQIPQMMHHNQHVGLLHPEPPGLLHQQQAAVVQQ
jgi:hypothetical protein